MRTVIFVSLLPELFRSISCFLLCPKCQPEPTRKTRSTQHECCTDTADDIAWQASLIGHRMHFLLLSLSCHYQTIIALYNCWSEIKTIQFSFCLSVFGAFTMHCYSCSCGCAKEAEMYDWDRRRPREVSGGRDSYIPHPKKNNIMLRIRIIGISPQHKDKDRTGLLVMIKDEIRLHLLKIRKEIEVGDFFCKADRNGEVKGVSRAPSW